MTMNTVSTDTHAQMKASRQQTDNIFVAISKENLHSLRSH